MKKTFYILLTILLAVSATAQYTPVWEVDFNNTLANYSTIFTAGSGSPATDAYEPSADVLQPPAPPSGAYIQMRTLVNSQSLIGDYRADLQIDMPKKWNITLIVADPTWQGLSGTNTLTWSHNAPANINLTLIDYGTSSTRTTPIKVTNMKNQSSYNFTVSNKIGPYRYINFIAEKSALTEEFHLNLNKGWNLISIPVNVTNKTISSIFHDVNYSKILTFDSGRWVELSNDDKINETKGLWINSAGNYTLELEGYEFEGINCNLNQGWNLIGYPYLEQKSITSLFNNATIYMYNVSEWYSYNPNRPANLNTFSVLKPGFGYVVKSG